MNAFIEKEINVGMLRMNRYLTMQYSWENPFSSRREKPVQKHGGGKENATFKKMEDLCRT